MTTKQSQLAKFLRENLPQSLTQFHMDGRLTVDSIIKKGAKKKHRSAALQFDDPQTLEGPVVIAFDGPYGEHLARQVFFGCLFIGQGEQAALNFVCECVQTVGSALSGAPQWFFDAHRQEIDAARPVEVDD